MLNLPSLQTLNDQTPMRIYCAVRGVDMRKGFDSLAAMVRDVLAGDPMSGDLFLFFSRRRDRLKILYFDRTGYALWYKRLELGVFRLPKVEPAQECLVLPASDLALLLEGVDLRRLRYSARAVLVNPAAASAPAAQKTAGIV